MTKNYTAVHWIGKTREVERFTAPNDSEAGEAFDEMGPNSYDARVLLSGHVPDEQIEARAKSAGV